MKCEFLHIVRFQTCRFLAVGVLLLASSAAMAQEAEAVEDEPDVEDVAAEADAPAESTATTAPAAPVKLKSKDPLEENFADYLHFALVGQFEIAEKLGKALLEQPELKAPSEKQLLSKEAAEKLLALSEKYKNSIDTLLLIINNTPIGEDAKRILELIRESHRMARMAPGRITENIKLLAGTPVQQSVGLERLVQSGEYAVPWMLEVLGNSQKQNLHPFVIKSLPLLGKKALNPLVEGLAIANPAVQGIVADTLGRIGYPQALPYLQRLATDPKANASVRAAADAAIARIVVTDPGVKRQSPADLFGTLAEQYYAGIDSLRPDASEPQANVWFLRDQILEPVEVPLEIYQFVMSMRAARASLALEPEQPGIVALWLAANFKREAALKLDVTSEEHVATADLTRPIDFPRSIYFARTFGPLYSQLALTRAIRDRDPVVALGAIAALDVTAGPATMIEPSAKEASGLPAALQFPDLLVRIRAALALAKSMPRDTFSGSEDVVPILASAVQLTGRKNYILVVHDSALRTQIADDLTRTGAAVIAVDDFTAALDRAQKEFTHLDGIFLDTDIERPSALEAVRTLAEHRRFGLTPVVLLVQQDDQVQADGVAAQDRRIGRVFVTKDDAGGKSLAEHALVRRDEVAPQYGHRELPQDVSLSLALEAAGTLRAIARSRWPVFEVSAAESSLILSLNHPSEELRVAAARVLALLNSATAQEAIAAVALGDSQTETLRVAAFGSLAESARQFGAMLSSGTRQQLIDQAVKEPNLTLRTAASQALGAMNLPSKPIAEIIIDQP